MRPRRLPLSFSVPAELTAKRQRCAPEAGRGTCEMQAMDERQVWEEISTAPYNRDIELAVVEADHVHPLIFACRRTASGWVKAASRERVTVSPTHWRPWHREG
jgi:hypothetical protein